MIALPLHGAGALGIGLTRDDCARLLKGAPMEMNIDGVNVFVFAAETERQLLDQIMRAAAAAGAEGIDVVELGNDGAREPSPKYLPGDHQGHSSFERKVANAKKQSAKRGHGRRRR